MTRQQKTATPPTGQANEPGHVAQTNLPVSLMPLLGREQAAEYEFVEQEVLPGMGTPMRKRAAKSRSPSFNRLIEFHPERSRGWLTYRLVSLAQVAWVRVMC